jgi:hypothetical protein
MAQSLRQDKSKLSGNVVAAGTTTLPRRSVTLQVLRNAILGSFKILIRATHRGCPQGEFEEFPHRIIGFPLLI